MQINTHFSPSFQRKLLAKTSLNDYCGDKVPCEFYLLDSTKDEDYLTKQENSGEWWNSIYFPLIASDYTEDKYYLKPNVSFYTMQNEDGDCLAIIEELKHSDGYRNIELMEVVPTCANRNSSRSIKYVGETMVAFFASMLRHEDEDENMCVSFPADDAKGFWKKLGFENRGRHSLEMIISEENIDALIEKNEKHNGSKIEFVG